MTDTSVGQSTYADPVMDVLMKSDPSGAYIYVQGLSYSPSVTAELYGEPIDLFLTDANNIGFFMPENASLLQYAEVQFFDNELPVPSSDLTIYPQSIFASDSGAALEVQSLSIPEGMITDARGVGINAVIVTDDSGKLLAYSRGYSVDGVLSKAFEMPAHVYVAGYAEDIAALDSTGSGFASIPLAPDSMGSLLDTTIVSDPDLSMYAGLVAYHNGNYVANGMTVSGGTNPNYLVSHPFNGSPMVLIHPDDLDSVVILKNGIDVTDDYLKRDPVDGVQLTPKPIAQNLAMGQLVDLPADAAGKFINPIIDGTTSYWGDYVFSIVNADTGELVSLMGGGGSQGYEPSYSNYVPDDGQTYQLLVAVHGGREYSDSDTDGVDDGLVSTPLDVSIEVSAGNPFESFTGATPGHPTVLETHSLYMVNYQPTAYGLDALQVTATDGGDEISYQIFQASRDTKAWILAEQGREFTVSDPSATVLTTVSTSTSPYNHLTDYGSGQLHQIPQDLWGQSVTLTDLSAHGLITFALLDDQGGFV
ncbi:MAG: hypothetical protein VW518_07570, partial [Burkholderiaceae bacterium]